VVCSIDQLAPGQRKIVDVAGRSIGVFNLNGAFHAIRNVCPHQMAPLCLGTISGTTAPTDKTGDYQWHRDGEIIRCPWHGWEFDITTGKSIFNPHRCRVKHYDVSVELGQSDPVPEDPSVETFDVAVESSLVVLYV